MEKSGLLAEIGADNCVASLDEGLARARRILPPAPVL